MAGYIRIIQTEKKLDIDKEVFIKWFETTDKSELLGHDPAYVGTFDEICKRIFNTVDSFNTNNFIHNGGSAGRTLEQIFVERYISDILKVKSVEFEIYNDDIITIMSNNAPINWSGD